MGMIMIRCPATRRAIPTEMKANRANFYASSVFVSHTYCQICSATDQWFAKDAWLCESPSDCQFYFDRCACERNAAWCRQ